MAEKLNAFVESTDGPRVTRMMSLAFGGTEDGIRDWLKIAVHENIRVLRDDSDSPLACLARVPMGQFFGGKSVPMIGIAGVAVPPEARGKGLARRMMREALLEVAREGAPLSGLFASTQTLYRQVGYEQSGHRFETRVNWACMPDLRGELPVRELTVADQPMITACYNAFAAAFDGNLDRGPYIWSRTWKSRDEAFRCFGVFDGDRLEGYLFLAMRRNPSGRSTVAMTDIAFISRRGGESLIRFLADYTTMSEDFVFFGGPLHPLLSLMPQQRFAVERKDYWMIRITDLPKAFAARGASRGVHASADVHVTDDLIPENAGSWRIHASDGAMRAERLASPTSDTLRCDIRALASMYAGLYTPRQAALMGWVEGDQDTLDNAQAVFPGGCPWMTEMY